MPATALAATPGLVERVTQLLEQVDYRRADSAQEKDAIYRLRYDAYLREGAIAPDFKKKVFDSYDELPNAWTFGVYIDGRLASSIRLHVASKDRPVLPAGQVFADILGPQIEAGKTIVDPTRFVSDPVVARHYPELPYVTVRLIQLGADFFGADFVLAAVRAEHQAFYKRAFGHRAVCEPRPYPTLKKPISLMMLDYPAAKPRVVQRYPFLRSTGFERRMLFERFVEVPQRTAA
jgi:hypothetical protein